MNLRRVVADVTAGHDVRVVLAGPRAEGADLTDLVVERQAGRLGGPRDDDVRPARKQRVHLQDGRGGCGADDGDRRRAVGPERRGRRQLVVGLEAHADPSRPGNFHKFSRTRVSEVTKIKAHCIMDYEHEELNIYSEFKGKACCDGLILDS